MDESKLVSGWQEIKKEVWDKNPHDCDAKVLCKMTLGEFLDKYPEYHIGISTIQEPPRQDFISDSGQWFCVGIDELIK